MLGIMRAWLFTLTAALFVVFCSPASWPVENLGIRSPIGPGTVPQSSVSSGLVDTPDPIDTTGNLLITGNVRRGMHFRGSVPYQSPTSFSSPLGSSALSSFLRDSAGPEDIAGYPYRYGPQPYYSATETVTTMVPGRPEVFSPAGARIDARVQQDTRSTGAAMFGLDVSPTESMLLGRGTAAPGLDLQGPQTQYGLFAESRTAAQGVLSRGMSLSPRDSERMLAGQMSTRREGETSAAERFQRQAQDAASGAQGSAKGLEPGSELGVLIPQQRENLSTRDNSLQYQHPGASVGDLRTRFETQTLAQSTTDAGQSAAARDGLSALDDFSPAKALALQGSSVQQTGAGETLLSAGYGDLAKRQIASADQSAGYTPASPSTAPSEGAFSEEQGDVLRQIKRQLEDLTRSVEASLQRVPANAGQAGDIESLTKLDARRLGGQGYVSNLLEASSQKQVAPSGVLGLYESQRVASGFVGGEPIPARAAEEPDRAGGPEGGARFEFPGTGSLPGAQNKTSLLDEFRQMSQADKSGGAKRIMGPHASLDSLSSAKFNEHIAAAEEHLRAGRYYRAADCFALAAVYKPDDPLVPAGRGHALFAAGEYMSSALFLSRALAICPEYAQVNVDLAALLGGQDKIAGRLADVEQWYARSGSSQLQLLLSYVYYRTGRLTPAKRAIDLAYQKMPQSPAVHALKAAIDGAAARP
jgi:tetratricopeptide (TPR) repeat protein